MHLNDAKYHTHALRISAKKTAQDNPYYYSNERLANCLHVMERLRTDSWLKPKALELRLTSVLGLEGGYRAACGEDACRIDISVYVSPPASGAELEQKLCPWGKAHGVCINVLDRGSSHVD